MTEFHNYWNPTQPAKPGTIPPWLETITHSVRAGQGFFDQLPPASRRPAQPVPGIVPSSVLMLFAGDPEFEPTPVNPFPEDAQLVLTHRSPHLRSHGGQMAFPGGRADREDGDPVATALREAHEEVGLDPTDVDILGVSAPIPISRTGNAVNTVVGFGPTDTVQGVHVASPGEVAGVYRVPVGELIEPAHRVRVAHGGWSGPAFWVDGLLLWGFTAGVVDTVLRIAGWEVEWNRRAHDLLPLLEASRNGESIEHWRG